MVACQVKGCPTRSSRVLKKSMFSIPDPRKERNRCEKWLCILGSEKFKIETYECIHNKSRVVCEDHFEPDCFEEDIRAKIMGYEPRKRLRPDAVPTIPFSAGKRHSSKTRSSPKRYLTQLDPWVFFIKDNKNKHSNKILRGGILRTKSNQTHAGQAIG